MVLAIIERIVKIPAEAPFDNRYYITENFKDIFDELDVLLFPVVSTKHLDTVCDLCDGLIVTGTNIDIPTHYYGAQPLPGKNYDIDEYQLDQAAIRLFYEAKKPILGICGGHQSLNIFFGGNLYQQIEDHNEKDKIHNINIQSGTFLSSVYGEKADVNTYHNLALKDVAEGFTVSATADDGTIEAIERGNIVAVQWHPEIMNDVAFFDRFIKTFF